MEGVSNIYEQQFQMQVPVYTCPNIKIYIKIAI